MKPIHIRHVIDLNREMRQAIQWHKLRVKAKLPESLDEIPLGSIKDALSALIPVASAAVASFMGKILDEFREARIAELTKKRG